MTTNSGQNSGSANAKENSGVAYCEIHKNKKVKFYCRNDHEMFCSKCVLKHTNAKHEVNPCSYKGKIIHSYINSDGNEENSEGNVG